MLGKPIIASLVATGEHSVLLYDLEDAVIIALFTHRTYRSCYDSRGSTSTCHGGNGLVDFLGGLHLFLGQIRLIVHDVQDLSHLGSCGGRGSHLFLLRSDRNHVLLERTLIDGFQFVILDFTGRVLESHEHHCERQDITKQEAGATLATQFVSH